MRLLPGQITNLNFFFCMGVQIPHREIACLKLTERHGAYWNNDTASQPASQPIVLVVFVTKIGQLGGV